ncbi:MAG: cytochrome c3 family protein, partial [Candidatus Zixiibacteriota bacterium]
MEKLKLPRLAYNWMSSAGAVIALVSGTTLLFLLGLSLLANLTNPYLGIFLYMVLPPILVVGLILIPIGMYRRWRLWQKGGEISAEKWPHIDLNQNRHRNAVVIFSLGTLLFLVLSAVGSYQAFHYTESIDFCGKLCHAVMEPEHTAYENSPHARIKCTACHIGPGAGWYAKSKLSGLYQFYAVTANIYPRPIPTPIKNLRPAQETCEQCHWPEKFFGAQQRQFNHYMYDQNNAHWPINMLIKTGGGDPKTGQTSGIHWHMNIGVKIEYIPGSNRLKEIPWVKVTDRQTGRMTIYRDSENPLSEEEIASARPRVMDCMDCHDRPSHVFYSPDYALDRAILTGRIDPTLPEIKQITVETMAEEYESKEAALRGIANRITEYYRTKYPELYAQKRVVIDEAILSTQEAYSQNIFPEMKARWSEYPDNIGHFIYTGCMRCHAGNHKSEEGLTITHDCNSCHTILSQGSGERAEVSTSQAGLEFKHPVDIDEAWKEMGCHECH